MVEETQIESNMTLNMNTYSNPTAYRLFSLFVYMTTNNLLPTRSVQEIYDWMYSNSCTWIFTEILKLKSILQSKNGRGEIFGPRYHLLSVNGTWT